MATIETEMECEDTGDPRCRDPGSLDKVDPPDPIIEEYQDWKGQPSCSSGPDNVISLENLTRDSEGKASIIFNLDSSQKFTLFCPLNYPENTGDEENFFLEADPSLQLWCNAVNEFILDRSHLRLSDVLSKSLSLYTSDSQKSRVESSNSNMFDSDNESDAESEDCYIGMDEDGQLDDCLDKDFEWEVEIARRKRRWKEKEEILRAESKSENQENAKEKSPSLQEVYHDSSLRNRQPKQVFTNAAASGILINDIISIMTDSASLGIKVDTVDDNIFQWNVRMSNFLGTPLDEDLRQVYEKFGYQYVELQLDFAKDLYPFFPPLVKVIRPRLQGSMMLRVTTMEILKLTYWNPTKDMKSVLTEIRNFLSTWARLDVGSERNDRVRYPGGAYIDIEHHLLRLALVSEVVPRANNKYTVKMSESSVTVKLPPSAMESRYERNALSKKEDKSGKQGKWTIFSQKNKDKKKGEEESPVKKMAKGVGYSTYSTKGWDIQAFLAAKQEKDRQIEIVLANIIAELKRLHSVLNSDSKVNCGHLSQGCVDKDSDRSNSFRRKRKLSPEDDKPVIDAKPHVNSHNSSSVDEQMEAMTADLQAATTADGKAVSDDSEKAAAVKPVDPVSDLFSVLEGSALIPFIESKLQANSFLEIGQHIGVYRQVVSVVRELCGQPVLRPLLAPLPEQHTSIHVLLQNLEQQANIMINRIGKASANGSVPKGKKKTVKSEEQSHNPANEGADILAKEFQILAKEVGESVQNCSTILASSSHQSSPESGGQSAVKSAATSNGHISPEPAKPGCASITVHTPFSRNVSDSEYCSALQSMQFDIIEFEESGHSKHSYQAEYTRSDKPSFQAVCRMAQDVASLASQGSLPLNPSSSIFVRSDENKTSLLRVIITGPEGTPYTGGIFEFDIFFPTRYPSVPPKVHFRTTGGGTVRFNPNLYQEGRVCLSLLGTWDGAQGEQWNQDTSTILQVLISIQSLILCPEPYYNEPGFERKYGTEVGQQSCQRYNENVLKNNLRFAISDALKCPPAGFEEIVKVHFYLKREQLIKELEEMSELYGKTVKKLVAEVTAELMSIEKPKSLKNS